MSETGLMDGRLDAWKAVVAKQACRIAELEKALKPFAHVRYFKGERHEVRGIYVTVGSLEDARTTLEASEKK